MLFVLGLFAIKVLSNNLGWSSWKEHVHRYSHRFTFSHSSPQKQTGKSTEADHHVRHSEADRLHRKHSSLQDTSPSNQGIIQSFIMNNTFRLRQTHVKQSFTNKFYYTVGFRTAQKGYFQQILKMAYFVLSLHFLFIIVRK